MIRKILLTLTTAVVTLAVFGLPGSAASSRSLPPGTKALHVTKDCSGSRGGVGSYCTIRSSNVKAIKAGSKIFYFQQSGKAALDSDIVIYVGPGTVATGHCLLHLASGIGLCTISDGTGTLAGFHARARVTADHTVPNLWHWDGTYGFGNG